jgi:hypothetical protein
VLRSIPGNEGLVLRRWVSGKGSPGSIPEFLTDSRRMTLNELLFDDCDLGLLGCLRSFSTSKIERNLKIDDHGLKMESALVVVSFGDTTQKMMPH